MASDTVDQFIAKALVVAFPMVVDHELCQRPTEVPLAKRNEAV
jgi:hypothetical protein